MRGNNLSESDGYVMTMDKFIKAVRAGGLATGDGFGRYACGNWESDIEVYPSHVKARLHTQYTHVVWYNK